MRQAWLQHGLPGFGEMLAVAQRRMPLRLSPSKLVQPCLALDQRLAAQVLAVEVEQVEDVEDACARCGCSESAACSAEKEATPVVGEHHDLAVDHRLARSRARPALSAIALPNLSVQSRPGRVNSFTLPSSTCACNAVAVELHLMQPFLARTAAFVCSVARAGGMKSRHCARRGRACFRVLAARSWRRRRLRPCLRADLALPASTSSIVRPDFTDSGASSRMSSPGRAKASSDLISSQLSRFSPRARLQPHQMPAAVAACWPFSSKRIWPFFMPAAGSPSGIQRAFVPDDHRARAVLPSGIVPSKEP